MRVRAWVCREKSKADKLKKEEKKRVNVRDNTPSGPILHTALGVDASTLTIRLQQKSDFDTHLRLYTNFFSRKSSIEIEILLQSYC